MQQTNISTQMQRPIRRVPIPGAAAAAAPAAEPEVAEEGGEDED